MEAQIESFIEYCHNVKGTSRNTELSYRRDLYQLADFLRAQYQMTRVEDLTATALYGYIRFLEKKQRKLLMTLRKKQIKLKETVFLN